MSVNKPAIPKGTRDFLPEQYSKRNYIFNTIETVFKKFGFKPIETPAIELLSTLTGKYGNEGDKLIFKILNSGDYLASIKEEDYNQRNAGRIIPQICEKALRYDLTVPFARFVVQHFNEITFPFRRYQIQPVWRADRPQKGRYREFYQCDVDMIGSNALINEAELIKITDTIFKNLDIQVVIKINNRKILTGIAEVTGIGDSLIDFTVALDKLDKIGWDKVKEELISKQIPAEAIDKIAELIKLTETSSNMLEAVSQFLSHSIIGQKGISELKEILQYVSKMHVSSKIEFDVTLARGLNYYTGAIFEVKAIDTEMGSICGGGRYDDLTGVFGLNDVSGVGISFGADRIYDVLEALNLFPETVTNFTQVLITNLGEEELLYSLPLLNELRNKNISSEIYPDITKIKKQMAYADKNKIKYVVIVGSEEMSKNVFTLKNMSSGEQSEMSMQDLIKNSTFF